jgi:hypothetical protein
VAITTSSAILVDLRLSKQWNGSFEGEILLTNTSAKPISQWSVSFTSRYALRQVSNFSLQQSQRADGTWLITLGPPRWGTTLQPNRASRSYMQGALPAGTRLGSLSSSEVLLAGSGSGSTPASTPTPTPTPTPGNGTTPLPPGGINSGNRADALWGEQFFAPYVDMGLYPVPDLDGLARQHGVGLFTLGFIQATPSGDPAWAGLQALTLSSTHSQAIALRQEINQLRAVGGDVMVSFGGAAGVSLAEKLAARGATANDLANRYRQVVDTLALNRIDFDIEGAALANRAANQLLASALKLLQQSHPDLEIWYTLPVLPQGLTASGLAVVRQALAEGVKLDGVNIMAMNYGNGAAPPALKSMGQYAIDAANASFSQLSELHRSFALGFGWNQLGVTPMIGVNDITSEVFTTTDAQLLEDFAREKRLGMLSMWSIARDNAGPSGQLANTHNGTAAAAGSFSAIWGDYGTDPLISGGLTGGAPPLPSSTIAVEATTSSIAANATIAERFQLGYAWGRQLTVSGFDPRQDVLDLRGFWAEGQKARVVASPGGASVLLDFNAQKVHLPGVEPGALTSAVVQTWQG